MLKRASFYNDTVLANVLSGSMTSVENGTLDRLYYVHILSRETLIIQANQRKGKSFKSLRKKDLYTCAARIQIVFFKEPCKNT
ncbi:hypothetical protein BDB00DRAFT_847609, partial [Zychaea mexicana]|uniref:uncharacterized protein n=1 Tax=Zychaea mexicana TaxID=64656 RepID=UPI0022FF06DE